MRQDKVIIRKEELRDIPLIHRVQALAFGREAEAKLVSRLREHGKTTVSLVAQEEGGVVGHILFSEAAIDSGGRHRVVQALAPLGVLPEKQRQGIGSLLVKRGLEFCKSDGHQGVVVLGDSSYYSRFGFLPARQFGIRCEYAVPEEAFMALELFENGLAGESGVVRYPPEFSEL